VEAEPSRTARRRTSAGGVGRNHDRGQGREGEEIEREQRTTASSAWATAARAAARAQGQGRTVSERRAGGERAAVAVRTSWAASGRRWR